MYGETAKHEKPEKKNTICGPFAPLFPQSLTIVYAMPAPRPPATPTIDAKNWLDSPTPGLITNNAPIKATITAQI